MASLILVKVVEHPMADGSKVYNVIIVDRDESTIIDLPAWTEACAYDLQETLISAIASKTLCTAQVA